MLNLTNPIINKIPHRIVITGGPLAGKSTILNELQKLYSHKARFMTEVASMLLSSGYPQPGRDLSFSEDWLDYINNVILPTQLNMENGHLHAADVNNLSAVFYDRGLLDPAGYIEGGKETLQNKYGLNIEDTYNRYSMVIHLHSIACRSHDLYDKFCDTNPSRYDTAEEAEMRDKAIYEAWKDHPNFIAIESYTGMEGLLNAVLAEISPLLDVEMEQKYLLNNIPEGILGNSSFNHLKQYYIYNNADTEMRIRSLGNNHKLTVKNGSGFSRTEWEVNLPKNIYDVLKSESLPNIKKMRYYIPYGTLMLELDIYDKPTGLITLECEFKSQDEANSFVLPTWAEDAINITDDSKYKNVNLAKLDQIDLHDE